MQILDTATRMFSRFGSKRVTIEELCREARVSKMTFYKYFPNKVALVRQIHDDLCEAAFVKFDEINAMEISFPEKIELMGLWKLDFASRVNAGFIQELIDVQHAADEHKRRYLRNIVEAQGHGDVRHDIDPEFLWMILESFGEILRDGRWKTVCSDLAAFQRQLRTLVWFGLLSR